MALTHAAPRADRPHIDRRAIVLLTTLLAGALGLLAMSALFLWPGDSARTIDAGRLEHFPPGSVTSFRIGEGELVAADPPYEPVTATAGMHVVRLENGDLRAFSWRGSRPGTTVRWETENIGWTREMVGEVRGIFYDPRFGGVWLMDGTRVFGPAPRNLDQFSVEITEGGRVLIDVSKVIEGERGASQSGDATPAPVFQLQP